MTDKNAGLRSELTPIVNDAFKRASSAQQAALPDAAPFVDAIIGVVGRYDAEARDRISSFRSSYNEELQAAASDVLRALKEEGKAPNFHRVVLARHRKEWPTLWRAIDRLVAATKESGK